MIGNDGAAVFQMDGVSRGSGEREQPNKNEQSYKEVGDT